MASFFGFLLQRLKVTENFDVAWHITGLQNGLFQPYFCVFRNKMIGKWSFRSAWF